MESRLAEEEGPEFCFYMLDDLGAAALAQCFVLLVWTSLLCSELRQYVVAVRPY